MQSVWLGRAQRAVGIACAFFPLAFGPSISNAHAEGARSSPIDTLEPANDSWRSARNPVWFRPTSQVDAPILVYPPTTEPSEPAKLIVMLHGMCGHPENACPWFAGPETGDAYVACPRADLACEGSGSIWSGTTGTRARLVASVRSRLEKAFDERLDPAAEGTLIGFSLGAFVALDVAEHSHGEWKRLVLIGAFVKPNAKKLKAAGVESVLFSSGDWDMSRNEMKKQARLLQRQGVRARYVGMGPVGHRFAKDMDSWLRGALDWLSDAGRDPNASASKT
jgi:predicted esterase